MLIANLNISSYDEQVPMSSEVAWRKAIERGNLGELQFWHVDRRRRVPEARAGRLTFDDRGAWLTVQLPLWAASNAAMAVLGGHTEATAAMRAVVLTARGNRFLHDLVASDAFSKAFQGGSWS